MTPRQRFGALLVGVGLLLCLLPFVSGSGTLGQCLETGLFYELFGIKPSQFRASVDLRTLEIRWFDGCNGRRSSLVPTLVGAVVLVVGVGIGASGADED